MHELSHQQRNELPQLHAEAQREKLAGRSQSSMKPRECSPLNAMRGECARLSKRNWDVRATRSKPCLKTGSNAAQTKTSHWFSRRGRASPGRSNKCSCGSKAVSVKSFSARSELCVCTTETVGNSSILQRAKFALHGHHHGARHRRRTTLDRRACGRISGPAQSSDCRRLRLKRWRRSAPTL
jgi:hypothetical protein